MYHIKQDRRSLTSAKMIVDGLRDCLYDRKFSEIGIRELCDKAEVSRSTFYRLFDNTVDVLQFLVDSLVKEASEEMAGENLNGPQYVDFYMDFIEKNGPLLETVLLSGRMDILSRALNEHSAALIPAELLKTFPENELDYLRAVMSSAAVALFRVNIQHGRAESPKELRDIFKKLLKLLYDNVM